MKIELHIRIGKKHLSVGSTRRVHSTYFFLHLCSSLKGYILPRILIMASQVDRPESLFAHFVIIFRRHDELSTLFEIISLTYFSTHSARTKPEIISISEHFCCCCFFFRWGRRLFDGEKEIKCCYIWPKNVFDVWTLEYFTRYIRSDLLIFYVSLCLFFFFFLLFFAFSSGFHLVQFTQLSHAHFSCFKHVWLRTNTLVIGKWTNTWLTRFYSSYFFLIRSESNTWTSFG